MNLPRTYIAAAALAATALCAAPAQAANVSVHDGVATYSAGSTVDNDLRIQPYSVGILFEEALDTLHPGAGCASINTNTVRCDIAGLESVTALMGPGDNRVRVTADYPTLIDGQGYADNDFTGGPRQDVMIGGKYADKLNGGAGSDELIGAEGEDELDGGLGNDTLHGGPQNDALDGGGNADVLDGGSGLDRADYSGRTTRVVASIDNLANDGSPLLGGEGDDIRSTVEWVDSGSGDDELTGSDDRDYLSGGPGDDLLRGRGGPDEFQGNAGLDTVTYDDRTGPVEVGLDGVAYNDGAPGEGDNIFSGDVEALTGGGGDDTLTGDAYANVLRGGDGSDNLDGGAGPDDLLGEDGDDTLRSEDGEPDRDDCGYGTDTALADAGDEKTACELPVAEKPADPPVEQPPAEQPPVEQPPVGQPPVRPALAVTPRKPRADRRGYVKLRLRCSPAGASGRCKGTLRLRRGKRVYASRRYSVAPGTAATVRVKVKRSLRRTLGRRALKVAVL